MRHCIDTLYGTGLGSVLWWYEKHTVSKYPVDIVDILCKRYGQ
jgi:hypothetical protein